MTMTRIIIAYMTLLSVVMSIVMASETLLAEKMISREHFSSLLRTAFEDEVTFSHLSRRTIDSFLRKNQNMLG